MNNATLPIDGPTAWQSPQMLARTRRRYARERRFRLLGLLSIGFAALSLIVLLVSVGAAGISGFVQTRIAVDVYFDPDIIGTTSAQARTPTGQAAIQDANYAVIIRESLAALFAGDVQGRSEKRRLARLVSNGARYALQNAVQADPDLIGQTKRIWLLADDLVDQFHKGKIDPDLPEADRPISDREIGWIKSLDVQGRLKAGFNWNFFSAGDSRDPEMAGFWGAIKGSFLTLLVTLAVAFPIGVAAAVYLEEFAPRNRWTD
ncbi:MAG: DUF3333 domain-containing protein, partial [Alphaproteobacteria bacterium]